MMRLAQNVGSVYRFNGLTGDLIATLEDPSPDGGDGFGSTIGCDARTIAIGAPFRSLSAMGSNGFEVGGVFLFDQLLNYDTLITPTTLSRQDRLVWQSGSGADLILGYQLGNVSAYQDAGSVLIMRWPSHRQGALKCGRDGILAVRRRKSVPHNRV